MPDNGGADGFGQFGQMSPGGFVFGVQGWMWGPPQPKTITFFLDNTASVFDQYGRPIRGTMVDNKEVLFAMTPPKLGDPMQGLSAPPDPLRKKYATHAQVIEALAKERIDWQKLTCAGFPQLPYEELKKLIDSGTLPVTPIDDLRSIKNPELRKAALKARREVNEAHEKEMQALAEE